MIMKDWYFVRQVAEFNFDGGDGRMNVVAQESETPRCFSNAMLRHARDLRTSY